MRGTVYAPDGVTPIAGCDVYAPKVRKSRTPSEEYYAATVSGPDGSFTLTGCPAGDTVVKFVKNSFEKTITVAVTKDAVVDLPKDQTQFSPAPASGAARMAVVTGPWDRIQDVLAKLGYGTLDAATNQLQLGTEQFALYNGDGSLPSSYPAADALKSLAEMQKYDIIFVNCGAITGTAAEDAELLASARSYVNGGGKLYVTDLSYDLVEQAFPSAIRFEGYGSTAVDAPEPVEAADMGTSGLTVDATVVDATLKSWLQGVGALNVDGTVRISGFLFGWAVMNSVAGTTKTFVEGNVDWSSSRASKPGHARARAAGTRATGLRPLTVTFPYGQGRVLYSSYHTEDEPAATLRPQESILAYLVFEL